MDRRQNAIAHFEGLIRDTDQVLPACSPTLKAELEAEREYYTLAIEALRTPQRTETQEALLRITQKPREF
ncbi:hypothetical protein B5G43_16725 [Flavonifractor sp. An92]|uniref:hypothetical protein n=1 Tax=Flavonifractor sp. An92 TaxID=1965666 RepID=UPI000B3AE7A4|nr:hypothetical protein [Flavonifractor sp. An92]OUN01979.1 hypothetical protein B5G43_16725 [Flavonifractor sp. An92]